jgi:SAM-dependent methyltransferase
MHVKPERGTLYREYQHLRQTHWDSIASLEEGSRAGGRYYHARLMEIYRHLIPPGSRVLELGCGKGDLLGSLEPAWGLGIDFSSGMVRQARIRHPGVEIIQADAHFLPLTGGSTFDFVILSDLLNDAWDVETLLKDLSKIAHPRTRILAEKLGLAKPNLPQNWLTVDDIHNLLYLAGFEVIRDWPEVLFPLRIPILSRGLNAILIRFWPFSLFALTNFIVARPEPLKADQHNQPSVSIIVPARNEEGNIPLIFGQLPNFGTNVELIFVEGHSTDGTYHTIEREINDHPKIPAKLQRQTGSGKGDAVRTGFELASGDIFMILDADLTVSPSDLAKFYEVVRTGRGEFANGVRLVYPMDDDAMRFFNLLGNKFFSLLFSWLLGQSIKDTLCGTKVLRREDYEVIAANRAFFGEDDPFGDFDLLLGTARLNRKIVDIPIRYRERTYGSTNISRWRHGFLLLKMAWIAARRLKFV